MKIVLALGGNALQSDPKDKSAEAQLKTCEQTAKSVVDLIEKGHEVAIVHGNGPQVGQILASFEAAHKVDTNNPIFPLDVVDGISQGYIGYHLQQAIKNELTKRNLKRNVQTLLTQVQVDSKDQGFTNPTKPIGSFFTKEEAEQLEKKNGYVMKEDAGRGYRRVVASPKPLDIVEKDIIKDLFKAQNIIITCGGGGIPVVKEEDTYKGVAAVIDKDFAAEKLAEVLDADMLLILTAVDGVYINYNTPDEKHLDKLSVSEANEYIKQGQFASGSMLPKVEACLKFVEATNKKAIIASLHGALKAIENQEGTVFEK